MLHTPEMVPIMWKYHTKPWFMGVHISGEGLRPPILGHHFGDDPLWSMNHSPGRQAPHFLSGPYVSTSLFNPCRNLTFVWFARQLSDKFLRPGTECRKWIPEDGNEQSMETIYGGILECEILEEKNQIMTWNLILQINVWVQPHKYTNPSTCILANYIALLA